ncbi:MAG TPA: hypothetical protein VGK96_24825, partial [Candidatus Sulfotelmatobacter sp.]
SRENIDSILERRTRKPEGVATSGRFAPEKKLKPTSVPCSTSDITIKQGFVHMGVSDKIQRGIVLLAVKGSCESSQRPSVNLHDK